MATVVRGQSLSTPQLVKYLDGERQPDGSHRAGVVYAVSAATLEANLPSRGVDTHPLLGAEWKCETYTWRHHDRVSSAVVYLIVWYVAPGGETEAEQDEDASSVAGEEPITSHPEFLQASGGGAGIAGTFENARTVDPATGKFEGIPRAGAVFDQYGQNKNKDAADYNPNVGRFLYFAPGFTLGGQSAVGLERYYVPRGTYARSYSSATKPSLAGVGKTVAAPLGAPALAAGYTWLRKSKAYRKAGLCYRITETYEAGRWNPTIYPEEA